MVQNLQLSMREKYTVSIVIIDTVADSTITKGELQPYKPDSRGRHSSTRVMFLFLCFLQLWTLSVAEKQSDDAVDPRIVSTPYRRSDRPNRSVGEDMISPFAANQSAYCNGLGSLHQIALDMFRLSSPPGSTSYNKFLHVLQRNPSFHINISESNILLTEIENNVVAMLQGFRLQRLENWTDNANATLVDVASQSWQGQSLCIIGLKDCLNQPRIVLQSEQLVEDRWTAKILPGLRLCHQSSNCIIVEYSNYNYKFLQDEGLAGSVVLLPFMTQAKSRLGNPEVESLKSLWNRSLDVVFYGAKTSRRGPILRNISAVANQTTSWKFDIARRERDISALVELYPNAKVCLVVHAREAAAALEYHRLSEVGRFGCVPVVETPADTFALESYRRCGRVVFADEKNLFSTLHAVLVKASRVDTDIDMSHVKWWNQPTRWSELLQSVLGAKDSTRTER